MGGAAATGCAVPPPSHCRVGPAPAVETPSHFSKMEARLMSAVVRNLTSRVASRHLQQSSSSMWVAMWRCSGGRQRWAPPLPPGAGAGSRQGLCGRSSARDAQIRLIEASQRGSWRAQCAGRTPARGGAGSSKTPVPGLARPSRFEYSPKEDEQSRAAHGSLWPGFRRSGPSRLQRS